MKQVFRLENLSAFYGNKIVVKNVNLALNEGEFCGLLGLNGSGKTTLLHAACGFVSMNGACYVKEKCCTGMNEKQRAREIAFIPQVCSLEGGKTALEAVLMGYNPWLSLLGSPSAEQKKKAYEVLVGLGCKELAYQDFGELSQGQRQMVTLARCMVQNTPVMLMDEPDSALDFLNKHIVLEKIRDSIKSNQKAGLITLHDPNFAMEYCDRLFLLKQGEILAEIHMGRDSMEEIRGKLSLIYGEIELFQNGTGYLMSKKKK